MSEAALEVRARAVRFGEAGTQSRSVAIPVEAPVEIALAGVPFAVMMASPADLEDFALGFCLTEGLIEARQDLRRIEATPVGEGIRLDLDLAPHCLSRQFARRRALSGRTGCGVCGIEDLASLERPAIRPVARSRIGYEAIERALAGLEERQALNALTHAVHGAAWAGRHGEISHLREDVGRHNALDKLIGALLADGVDPAAGFVLITSRCSFEMVEKAAAFGAGLLVAISAPTSLALSRARALSMRLVAIARRDGVTEFLDPAPAELVA